MDSMSSSRDGNLVLVALTAHVVRIIGERRGSERREHVTHFTTSANKRNKDEPADYRTKNSFRSKNEFIQSSFTSLTDSQLRNNN